MQSVTSRRSIVDTARARRGHSSGHLEEEVVLEAREPVQQLHAVHEVVQ